MANLGDERGKDGGYAASATVPVAAGATPANVHLLCFAFNQDYSCFVCGTTAGFRVYKASPVEEVHRRETPPALQHKSVVLIAMLFKTNIFAMVTISDEDPSNSGPNKVHIWDDSKQKIVGELRCRNEVKGVALRRDIIAMICEYNIYVYTCSKLEVIATIPTIANSRGLCALAPSGEPWILVCPVFPKGAVKVQVGQDDPMTHVFTAHQTALAAISLNDTGSLVATASETGTVVKVFKVIDGQLLYRLRRGAGTADIHCLTFKSDRFLAVASSSSTVHIFKLDPETREDFEDGGGSGVNTTTASSPVLGPQEDPEDPPDDGDLSIDKIATQIQKAVTKVASRAETVTSMVKTVVPSYFNDLRSFAQFRLPDLDTNGQPTVDARSKQARILGPQLAFHHSEPRLFVLHYSGVLYECSFRLDHDVKTLGTQDCSMVRATTWFAVRPDFKVQGPNHRVATVAGGANEDGDEGAEEWQLL